MCSFNCGFLLSCTIQSCIANKHFELGYQLLQDTISIKIIIYKLRGERKYISGLKYPMRRPKIFIDNKIVILLYCLHSFVIFRYSATGRILILSLI